MSGWDVCSGVLLGPAVAEAVCKTLHCASTYCTSSPSPTTACTCVDKQELEVLRSEGKIRSYGLASWDCFRTPADSPQVRVGGVWCVWLGVPCTASGVDNVSARVSCCLGISARVLVSAEFPAQSHTRWALTLRMLPLSLSLCHFVSLCVSLSHIHTHPPRYTHNRSTLSLQRWLTWLVRLAGSSTASWPFRPP